MPEPGDMRKAGASDLVIAVMARSPAGPGETIKTRLSAVVPDAADRVALYAAFLADTLAACRRVPDAVVRVAYTPEGGDEGFAALGLSSADLLVQRGADLGARERSLFEDLFLSGFRRALIVGSDLPTLPAPHLIDAAAALDRSRVVVLGPTADGGYYLMGLRTDAQDGRTDLPDLFSGIRWSTSDALGDTVAAAERAGWDVRMAARWYDVDDAEGLARLKTELRQPEVAARTPQTAAALRRIGRRAESGIRDPESGP